MPDTPTEPETTELSMPAADVMQAVQATAADAATLASTALPIPAAAPGEVLVEVHATAVTAGELSWPETWPAIPCHDLSGVIAAIGADVTDRQVGEAVYALIGFDRPGAAAQYVTLPASHTAAKPASITHIEAAAMPLGALTAWQALHDHAQLQSGHHVLVHGGAGGVGSYAVQLAASHGARVTATASARDARFVADLGAHHVLDYGNPFDDTVRDIDIVIDPVGGETMARSWPVLRPGGILVAIAEPPGDDRRQDVRSAYFVVEPNGEQLRQLALLIEAGQLRPVVSAIFGLSRLADAFLAQQARTRPGKIVVAVRDT